MPAFDESVTHWIEGMKQGHDDATARLWERYFERLVNLSSRRLGAAPRRIADEEDVAVSVFECLREGAAAGRFERLEGRDDLWKLLTAMARMKAVDQIRHQTAIKRGGRDVRGESVFQAPGGETTRGIDQIFQDDPTPDVLLSMEERIGSLFEALPDETPRQVARLRLQGFTNQRISEQLGISLRSVERKLSLIREVWLSMLENDAE